MNDFWNSFTDIFNNREIALVFWLISLILFTIFKLGKGFLKDIFVIVRDLFSRTILTIQLSFWGYLIGIIFLLKYLGLWNLSMMKDTIIFLSITALMLVMKIATEKNREQSLKTIFADAVKPIIFAEFIMNLESFSLITELIVLPLMMVLYAGAYSNKDKPEQQNIVKGFNLLLGFATIVILGYGIHYLYVNFSILDKKQTIRNFLFPVLITIFFMPYLYGALKYFEWDNKRVQKKVRDLYK